MARGPTPRDRHPDDGCRIAHDRWWSEIARKGDPVRRPNLVGEAFEAGWRSAMEEVKEAEAFLRKIQQQERREELEVDAGGAKWGCHVDAMPDNFEPDGCVIDEGRRGDCVYASDVKRKEQCKYWRRITPTSVQEALDQD